MNNEIITLVTVLGEKRDDDGFLQEEITAEVEIFAGIKSVGRTEYYEAFRSGIQASIIFLVDQDDFKLSEREITVDGKLKKVKASRVVYDGTSYLIRRTFRNNFGMLEMTCSEVE